MKKGVNDTMDNYIQEIIKEKEKQDKRITDTLAATGSIPDFKNPAKQVPLIDELIIKITYLHKIFFLAELVELFSFSYSKAQLEKIVLELEKTGYIKSGVDTDYGKYFCLTKEAVYFIKYNPSFITIPIQETNISDRKIPENLFSYKCLAKITSTNIFNMQAQALHKRFKAESKEYRRNYAKMQYIRHFIYKEFLQFKEAEKELLLKELRFEQSEITRYSKSTVYSNSFSEEFANHYISIKGSDWLDKMEDYQRFRKSIIQYCLKAETGDLKRMSHFLADYFNTIMNDKKEFLKTTYQQIIKMNNSYFTNGIENVIGYMDRNGDRDIYKYQKELNRLIQTEKCLRIKKSALIKSNAYKDEKTKDELQEINRRLEALENELGFYVGRINLILNKFCGMVFYKIKENGTQDFREQDITINRLASNGIYITDFISGDNSKDIVEFAVIQNNQSSICSHVLFNKIEKTYLYCQNVLPNHEMHINVYAYGESEKADIEEALIHVKKQFKEVKGYGILFSLFDDMVKITDCKSKNTERYETYNFIRNEMNKLSSP